MVYHYLLKKTNGSVIFLGSFCILEYYEYYGCRIPHISRMGQSMDIMLYDMGASCKRHMT